MNSFIWRFKPYYSQLYTFAYIMPASLPIVEIWGDLLFLLYVAG